MCFPSIDAGRRLDGVFELSTLPSADEPTGFAVFSKHRIIDDPSPLPATLPRSPFVLGMAPDGDAYLQARAPQTFEPEAGGQSARPLRRDVLVPSRMVEKVRCDT